MKIFIEENIADAVGFDKFVEINLSKDRNKISINDSETGEYVYLSLTEAERFADLIIKAKKLRGSVNES